jgi:phosphatidylglycerol lysyltransferase
MIRIHTAGNQDKRRARALVLQHGWNATAYQILNPGLSHWFSTSGDALVGYVCVNGTRVVAGAPVCSVERLQDVVREFNEDSERCGVQVCYFGAGERLEEQLRRDDGWSAASLGAQPSWDPAGWAKIVTGKSSLRAQLNRARHKGVVVREWPTARVEKSAAIRGCLSEWLEDRPLPSLHFLVEPETLGDLEDRRVFVAEHGEAVIAFLVASPVPARNGWLIEQIVRGRDAVNGTAELMVDVTMRALHTSGAQYVTLGLSPLSRHSRFDRRRMPAWLRLALYIVREHGRRFYNFEGLDRFKAKFEPHAWEEIVALSNRRTFPLGALRAIASAFSGGSPVWLVTRALGKRIAHEARFQKLRVRSGAATRVCQGRR